MYKKENIDIKTKVKINTITEIKKNTLEQSLNGKKIIRKITWSKNVPTHKSKVFR